MEEIMTSIYCIIALFATFEPFSSFLFVTFQLLYQNLSTITHTVQLCFNTRPGHLICFTYFSTKLCTLNCPDCRFMMQHREMVACTPSI
nr:hypothetical protein Itr_chr14CG04230 [Ipomoea trifida]